jgi:hypothetical protein
VAIIVSLAAAPAPAGSYKVLGPGTTLCSQYTAYHASSSRARRALADSDVFWMLGYVTAYNQYVDPDGDVLPGAGPSEIETRLSQHCRAHPDDDIATAARAFIEALLARKHAGP